MSKGRGQKDTTPYVCMFCSDNNVFGRSNNLTQHLIAKHTREDENLSLKDSASDPLMAIEQAIILALRVNELTARQADQIGTLRAELDMQGGGDDGDMYAVAPRRKAPAYQSRATRPPPPIREYPVDDQTSPYVVVENPVDFRMRTTTTTTPSRQQVPPSPYPEDFTMPLPATTQPHPQQLQQQQEPQQQQPRIQATPKAAQQQVRQQVSSNLPPIIVAPMKAARVRFDVHQTTRDFAPGEAPQYADFQIQPMVPSNNRQVQRKSKRSPYEGEYNDRSGSSEELVDVQEGDMHVRVGQKFGITPHVKENSDVTMWYFLLPGTTEEAAKNKQQIGKPVPVAAGKTPPTFYLRAPKSPTTQVILVEMYDNQHKSLLYVAQITCHIEKPADNNDAPSGSSNKC